MEREITALEEDLRPGDTMLEIRPSERINGKIDVCQSSDSQKRSFCPSMTSLVCC